MLQCNVQLYTIQFCTDLRLIIYVYNYLRINLIFCLCPLKAYNSDHEYLSLMKNANYIHPNARVTRLHYMWSPVRIQDASFSFTIYFWRRSSQQDVKRYSSPRTKYTLTNTAAYTRSSATWDILRSFEEEHFETSSQVKHPPKLPNDNLRNCIRRVAYSCSIHRNVPLLSNTMLWSIRHM